MQPRVLWFSIYSYTFMYSVSIHANLFLRLGDLDFDLCRVGDLDLAFCRDGDLDFDLRRVGDLDFDLRFGDLDLDLFLLGL